MGTHIWYVFWSSDGYDVIDRETAVRVLGAAEVARMEAWCKANPHGYDRCDAPQGGATYVLAPAITL